MEGLGWLGAIIVGGLAGWIASGIMKINTGIFLNIILGILGAIVLNAILIAVFHSTLGGWLGQLVVGAIGACILIALLRAVRGRPI
ncbi:MAG: GlsB/YeaQ/YmgE family stress response rane protein [Hyphomicrobiales bacterium]|nr:GlsB/YeaQ/YmgE family stress response rane protein [Hyphomicrobiales bacterium]